MLPPGGPHRRFPSGEGLTPGQTLGSQEGKEESAQKELRDPSLPFSLNVKIGQACLPCPADGVAELLPGDAP